MPNWTPKDVIDYLYRSQAGAQSQPAVRDDALAAEPREAGHSTRFRIRIVSVRSRLCDPDNLCPKYFIDCLRYAEIIPDDTFDDIELAVSQRKCKKGEAEHTVITVEHEIPTHHAQRNGENAGDVSGPEA